MVCPSPNLTPVKDLPCNVQNMSAYDVIGCIHGVYICPGCKSNNPRPSTASDVSAGSTKTIVNNRYQKYICNCTNKPSLPSKGGLCGHPLTQCPDNTRPMMLKEQDKSKPKVTWHNIYAPLAHLSSADATCIQCATTS